MLDIIGSIWTAILAFIETHSFLFDGLKFLLAGTFLDFSRRAVDTLYNSYLECFTMTATIPEDDPAFAWIKYYLIKHSLPGTSPTPNLLTDLLEVIWPRGRVPARKVTFVSKRPWTSLDDDQHEESGGWWVPRSSRGEGMDKRDLGVYCHPSWHSPQALRFKGHTLMVRLVDKRHQDGMVIWTTTRSRTIFPDFLNAARKTYLTTGEGRLSVYEPRPYPGAYGSEWRLSTSRAVRPWGSIILPKGVKEGLLGDVREFLGEREFYEERGVPWRRGWLFFGVPGSGKTSLIGALASELKLDIYFINLGSGNIDDVRLQSLFRAAPRRCIVVLEDIDCATTKRRVPKGVKPDNKPSEKDQTKKSVDGVNGESGTEAGVNGAGGGGSDEKDADATDDDDPDKDEEGDKDKDSKADLERARPTVTLSGLLNAIDGIASSEGRLMFCTTNHIGSIDPALIRPGRCDVRVEFKNATRLQAVQLFEHFYASRKDDLLPVVGDINPRDFSTSLVTQPVVSEKEAISSNEHTMPPTPASTPKTPHSIDSVPPVSNLTNADSDRNGGDSGGKGETGSASIHVMARKFADRLPEGSVSVSAIQGYLMRYKRRPGDALLGLEEWVQGGYDQAPAKMISVMEGQADDEDQ